MTESAKTTVPPASYHYATPDKIIEDYGVAALQIPCPVFSAKTQNFLVRPRIWAFQDEA